MIGATGSFFCLDVIVSWLVVVVVLWLVVVVVLWLVVVVVSCLVVVVPSRLRKLLPRWTPSGNFLLPSTSRINKFLS